ncbi:glycosyltransferase family 4 protein [uncultured Enterovirga sp.]|uniref:glycosyltransferase family 4 protein n=1 Tax=uncultured Enterovirga sp. TaxID=2026352 RepID=UPI0035CADF34
MTRPIRVLLGADGLHGARSGVGRYTLEVATRLAGHHAIEDLALLIGGAVRTTAEIPQAEAGDEAAPTPRSGIRDTLGGILGEVGPLRALRNRVRMRALGRRLDRLGRSADCPVIYHETNLIPVPFDGPCTVTVHDLFWRERPDLMPPGRLRWLERNVPRWLRQAQAFACVSAFTAAELRRHFPIGDKSVAVVPGAASARFRPMGAEDAQGVLDRYGLADRGYVLAVTTLEPRKNLDRLAAAHAGLPTDIRRRYPLVVVGGDGWGPVLARTDAAQRAGDLRLLGFVPDASLAALVARARLMPMVSLYEGYGLPVVEAMAAGTPVLAASTTATAEIAGSAGVMVDPLDVEAIRDGLRRLIDDPTLWSERRAAGLLRSAAFSWDRSVADLITLWRRTLDG